MFNILDVVNFCEDHDIQVIFSFLGNILTIIKIVVPIILILMGSISLAKAMMSSENDSIKKATSSLTKKAIIAVIIFFIPSIVSFLMTMIGQNNNSCLTILLSPDKFAAQELEKKVNEAQNLLKEGQQLDINGKKYTVKVGDTIESISKENNIDKEKLIDNNNLTNEFSACKLSELILEENCDVMNCPSNNQCTQIDGTWYCCLEKLEEVR